MKTELFIKIPTNETNPLLNSKFLDGLNNWTVFNGTQTTDYGACYPGVGGGIIYQEDIITAVGLYKIGLTVVPPKSGVLEGSVNVQIGAVSLTFDAVGSSFQYLELPTYSFDRVWIIFNGGFNGGITNISVEGVSGTWKEIELYNDEDIPLTLNVADISDITTKNANYSKTIVIPGSPNNNIIFENIFNISEDDTFMMNKSFPSYILNNGTLILDGNFELLRVSKTRGFNEYEGIVYSDYANLFTQIGNKLLTGNSSSGDDIDFSEYNHILTPAIIKSSWANTNGSGYVYAPINKDGRTGTSFVNPHKFLAEDMSACLYIKEIFDKILEKEGFTYESDFLNSNYFKKLVYPSVNRNLYIAESTVNKTAFSADFDNETIYTATANPVTTKKLTLAAPSAVVVSGNTQWELVSQGDDDPWDEVLYEYTVPIDGYYDINFNFQFDVYLRSLTKPTDWYLYTAQCKPTVNSYIYKNTTILYQQTYGEYLTDTVEMHGGSKP